MFRKKSLQERMPLPKKKSGVKRVRFFPTIKRVLEKNGLREGEHYAVLDNKEVFGKRFRFGKMRMSMDWNNLNLIWPSGVFYAIAAPQVGHRLALVISMPVLLALLKFKPFVRPFESKLYSNLKEIEKGNMIESLSKLAETGKTTKLTKGIPEYVAFSRYGGKTFLLTKKAAAVLRLLKPGKVVGRLEGKKQ